MKLFNCASCGNLLHFDNVFCTQYGATLGFLSNAMRLAALESAGDEYWQPVSEDRRYRMCSN